MANFVRPFAERLRAKRKQVATEIAALTAVIAIICLWFWWNLPPVLGYAERQTIAQANTPKVAVAEHRITAQLNLLNDIAEQLALIPTAELTDIEIFSTHASANFAVHNSASAHDFNLWQFRNWQLKNLQLLASSDGWQVNLHLTLH